MNVTINTDASWSPRHKGAGFAFWIVSNAGKIAKSGILKGVIDSPDHAELSCIANAFHCLSKQGWPITKIYVNTDSMHSIYILNNESKKCKRYGLTGPKFEILRLHIRNSIGFKIPIEFRHVRSHQSTDTKRQWVNDWCDKEAKANLQKWHKQQGR